MAGETLSGSLSIIVGDLRKKSVTKALKQGVCKNLVTVYNEQGGNEIKLPVWDMTAGGAAIAKTEATDYTEFASYKNTTWAITPGKVVFGTKLTDEDKWYANESVREAHADKHAWNHALKLEQSLVATFASFSTNTVAATSTSGLTVSKVMDSVTKLEASAYDMDRPYNLVTQALGYNYLAKDMSQTGNSSNYGPVGPLADDVLKKYFVNSVMGIVNVFQTTTQAIGASSTAVGALFTKAAIGLFVPLYYEFETERDVSAGVTELVSRAVYGARVRFNEQGVKLTHRAI
jgi:hypothetical protein